jgi:uncharacterized membrane protein
MATRRNGPRTVSRLRARVVGAAVVTGLGVVTLVPGASAGTTGCHPRVIDMGTLGGTSSEIIESNNRGTWVGTARDMDEVHKAVIWKDGKIQDLGTVGEAEGFDVNNNGTVGGNHKLSETSGVAFIWRQGVLRDLASPFATGLRWMRRLNDRGDVAGSALDTEGVEHPVVWPGGDDPVVLPIPEGYLGAYLMAINDRGDMVGGAYTEDMLVAWGWDKHGNNHQLADIDLDGFSQANVLDNQGRAAGISDFGGNPGGQAALWYRGTERSLGVFGDSDYSFALGTNWKGDYVGVGGYFLGDEVEHVFLTSTSWHGQLRTLMPLSGDPSDESKAHAVTGGNVTVGGSSLDAAGEKHATVWTCAYEQAFVPDVDGVRGPSTGSSAADTRTAVLGGRGPASPAQFMSDHDDS